MIEIPLFNLQFTRFCHPERSEGSAVRRQEQVLRLRSGRQFMNGLVRALLPGFHHLLVG